MDPNITLKELRELIRYYYTDQTHVQLIDLFDALDNWMKMGGFLPDEWNTHQRFEKSTQGVSE